MVRPGAAGATFRHSEGEEISRALANAVEGEVRFGLHDRMLYATDASMYQVEPLGVVIPRGIEDAARAVAFCIEHGLPILPRGGGTSLAGQCTNRAVVIDFSAHCARILELDAERRRCRVEPGISIDDLNDAIAPSGLFFAPDPATSRQSNIGGNIGNNAAGARSIRYGRTSENLAGVDAMLADGSRCRFDEGAALRDSRIGALTERVARIVQHHAVLIRERYPRTIRRNAGYALDMILDQLERPWRTSPLEHVNLARLICGSEGTLAVTLGAELVLHPRPVARGLGVVGFGSVDEAVEAVLPILATGPTAVELLDEMVIGLARQNVEYRRYVELLPAPKGGPAGAVLYVEYSAETSADELPSKFAELARVVPGAAMETYTDQEALLRAWKLRKAGEPLLHGVPGRRKPVSFVEDNAVPVENLPRFVREFRAIVGAAGTRAAFWAHASVGVLHVRPLLDPHDEADLRLMREIAVKVADLARSLGGVMSGEHGDGRVRGPLLDRFFGPELMNAMREVKAAFDPRNLLNPGNIVEPGPIDSITERTRFRPNAALPRVPEVATHFNYADQHGFAGAVEMCNGAGVCRKKSGGTMCPSYMATLDERHSTRGRGNALRLAITGQFGSARWNDPDTLETLDLCLSCKACKSECPSNVDIARLKAEYLAQRARERGRPELRSLLLGNTRLLNRIGSLAPGLANAVGASAPGRALLGLVLGFDSRRSLPPFASSLARTWRRADRGDRSPRAAPTANLFADCFTMYNEPAVGLACRRLLRACGHDTALMNAGCCGRAKISLGLLDEATDEIGATLERLAPAVERGEPILFAEPSCLSAVKDDWLSLRLRTPLALRKKVAANAWLVEEFIERAWDRHPRAPRFAPPEGRVLLHGHCHQKALWGAETSARLLRRIAGEKLAVLDTGCCGMAGAFGFARGKFDLSMRIAELALLPAARREPGATICAPGTSCRHQLHDAGFASLHPVEFAASRLRE